MHPTAITKRDGSTAPFDAGRISAALERAFAAAQMSNDSNLIEDLTATALDLLKPFRQPTVELVQDAAVCALLMHNPPLYSVVKAYALYRAVRARSRALQLSQASDKTVRRLRADVPVLTPWGPLGILTYTRTYARRIEGTARTETFPDTIARVLSAAQKQLGVGFTDAELERAWNYMLQLKGSVAGRMLWQLGTSTVDRLGLASTQNCAFVCVSSLRAFTWAADLLMLGSGVGFSVQRRYVDQLPPVLDARIKIRRHDVPDADYIVADSREGWVGLLEEVLDAYFNTGKSFTYNAALIRPAGSPIKGFGGISGGAASLVAGITHICEVLDKARGRKLRSVQVLDVMNIIGTIVAGGNVRRSAQIAIGDADDADYLRAKRWDLGDIPNWRSQSNNSVVASSLDDLHEDFWAGYEGKGEAYGLINLELMRKVGRLADGDKYPDPDVNGVNPCAEQGLADYETCCLAELFLPNITSYEELEDVATILYRICKHSLLLPCHLPETASVVRRNMRMGIGVTGVLQASEEQRSWLPALYERLRAYDAAYSDAHGMARSVKLTTTKPSGTLSLLAGVTPGWHPSLFRYYVRRIRIASCSPLIGLCRAHGYHVEPQQRFDGTLDRETYVVEFPCATPEGVPVADDLKAVDQLEVIRRLQTEWSDNAVSNTVYYQPEELPAIKEWLKANYSTQVKTFSAMLQYGHGFAQAPYSPLSREEYESMAARVRPMTDESCAELMQAIAKAEDDAAPSAPDQPDDTLECGMGGCPVR